MKIEPGMQAEPLRAALRAWTELLGPARVLCDAFGLQRYEQGTGPERSRVPAALQPHNADEIAAIVTIALRFQVPLYPISTGHNWGYGSSCSSGTSSHSPAAPACVVVDLSQLKRIIACDPELGLVTLEPGVTQQQLADYLDQHGYDFMVPTTGAGPTCSIVGNALERGYGITPQTDHFGAVTSLEAVLPDGRLYRPALAALGASEIDCAYKWGVGPYLDGLFAQGNFGIVTQMTIALARRPQGFQAFFFSSRDDAALERLADASRAIMARLPGIVGAINLMNRHRILAMTIPYPNELAAAHGTLPADTIARLGRTNQVGAWTGAGALYGEPQVVAAAQKVVRQLLAPATDRLLFMTPPKVRLLRRLAGLVPGSAGKRLHLTFGTLEATLQIMLGRPSEAALPLAYWKSGGVPVGAGKLDPARDGCGLIWYPPLVPMKSAAVRSYVSHVVDTCQAHGIEPLITLTALSERCFDSSVPILFNQNNPAQVAAAQQCYRSLFDNGVKRGFVPYRLGPQAMRQVAGSASVCWGLVGQLKSAIDPAGIFAPGRYAPTD